MNKPIQKQTTTKKKKYPIMKHKMKIFKTEREFFEYIGRTPSSGYFWDEL